MINDFIRKLKGEHMIKYFVTHEDEFDRIDEGLECRNLRSNDVISIVQQSDNDKLYFVFYKC